MFTYENLFDTNDFIWHEPFTNKNRKVITIETLRDINNNKEAQDAIKSANNIFIEAHGTIGSRNMVIIPNKINVKFFSYFGAISCKNIAQLYLEYYNCNLEDKNEKDENKLTKISETFCEKKNSELIQKNIDDPLLRNAFNYPLFYNITFNETLTFTSPSNTMVPDIYIQASEDNVLKNERLILTIMNKTKWKYTNIIIKNENEKCNLSDLLTLFDTYKNKNKNLNVISTQCLAYNKDLSSTYCYNILPMENLKFKVTTKNGKQIFINDEKEIDKQDRNLEKILSKINMKEFAKKFIKCYEIYKNKKKEIITTLKNKYNEHQTIIKQYEKKYKNKSNEIVEKNNEIICNLNNNTKINKINIFDNIINQKLNKAVQKYNNNINNIKIKNTFIDIFNETFDQELKNIYDLYLKSIYKCYYDQENDLKTLNDEISKQNEIVKQDFSHVFQQMYNNMKEIIENRTLIIKTNINGVGYEYIPCLIVLLHQYNLNFKTTKKEYQKNKNKVNIIINLLEHFIKTNIDYETNPKIKSKSTSKSILNNFFSAFYTLFFDENYFLIDTEIDILSISPQKKLNQTQIYVYLILCEIFACFNKNKIEKDNYYYKKINIDEYNLFKKNILRKTKLKIK